MKASIFLLFLIASSRIYALNIAQIGISAVSGNAINISLNTEADELYYFQSWQYAVSGNIITVEACFIPGFGSTIDYLNNNFEIPIDVTQPQTYRLIVKAYYTFYDSQNLEDMIEATFQTPISTDMVLFNNTFRPNVKELFFTNPSNGKILVNNIIKTVWVFDVTGRLIAEYHNKDEMIDLSNIENGLYILAYFKRSQYKTTRIILRRDY